MPHPRRWLVNLALLAAAVLLTLLVAEGALRVLKINSTSIVRFVPGKGLTYLPNASYVHNKEGASRGVINPHGFRDKPRSYEAEPGVFRILVFGDSYIEGFQLPMESTFCSLLEKNLDLDAAPVRVEVLNLGHSGFGTADEYQRYLHFGTRYDHDLVLVAVYLGNDIRNNSKYLSLGRMAYYYDLDRDGNLVLDSSLIDAYGRDLGPMHRAFQWLKRRSYLASLLSERLFLLRKSVREWSLRESRSEADAGEQPVIGLYDDENIYLEDPPRPWAEAYRTSRAVLSKFHETVEANGARFVVVTIGSAEMVHADLQRMLDRHYGLELDYMRPDRFIRQWAEEEGVPYLGLAPLFLEEHSRSGEVFHGFGGARFGHWNEHGHALAARLVATFLSEHGLIEKPPGGEGSHAVSTLD